MLERYCSKSILCQIFYKSIYCLLVLVTSMFIAFSVLMNIILSVVLSATEIFCNDSSIGKQKRHAYIYRNKVFPRNERFSRHYHRRTSDVQQQTEKYFDCLETRWSKLLPIESYKARNDSCSNILYHEPNATNGQIFFEYDGLNNNNVKDNNVVNNNNDVAEEQTTKNSRWLWFKRPKNETKLNVSQSKSKKLKQDNPWNRLDILNKTNELTNNINRKLVKNNAFLKTLLRPFKNSQSVDTVLSGLNEKVASNTDTPSQTLYTLAQFDFFWPQTLPVEQITQATSEYTPAEMNGPFFWKEESKQNLSSKQKNENLKIKEISHKENNLYSNYFQPKTVIPTLMDSLANITDKISNLPIDTEFQLPKGIPKFTYYTISVDQLEQILHRYGTTTRQPLSLIDDHGAMSYFISNHKLAPQIVKAMRRMDKTVLNYPARVHYDLYKIPAALEQNIDNQKKNITDLLQQIISNGRFQNNDNYK